MEFFRIRRTIPFMRYSLILNAISAISFLIAVGFLVFRGLNLSIEFTGGTVMEVAYQEPAQLEQIRAAIERQGGRRVSGAELRHVARCADSLAVAAGFTSGQQAERVMETLRAQDPTWNCAASSSSARRSAPSWHRTACWHC